LEQKKREVDRLESLVEDGAIPKKRLLDAESKLKSIEARVEAASSRIAQFEGFQTGSGAGALTLRAPISGKIVQRHVSTGQYVEEGEPIARIVDNSRLRLEARISQSNLSDIENVTGANLVRGDESLTLSEEHKIASRTVLDEQTRTASTWFSIPDGAGKLTPGAYHSVEIGAGSAEKRLTVPKSAVIETKGLSVVYIVEGGERFRRQLVETGIEDGRWIEIKRGLEPGQRVATKGAYYLMLAASTSGSVGHHSH
jgi:RND family efflux transporter MFP subunit